MITKQLTYKEKRYNPFTRWSWLDELARPANMKLAWRAGSVFARRLLDDCLIV